MNGQSNGVHVRGGVVLLAQSAQRVLKACGGKSLPGTPHSLYDRTLPKFIPETAPPNPGYNVPHVSR